MKKLLVVGVIVLFLGLAIAPSINADVKQSNKSISSGNTLYVGGSGPNNYTKIQDAIDDASDGDTVFVYNGTYYENQIEIDKSIYLNGENSVSTVIDSGSWGYAISINANHVIISNLTLMNSGGMCITSGKNHSTIKNNIILGDDYCIYLHSSDNSLLVNNIIDNTAIGAYIHRCHNITISGNSFSNNTNGYYGLLLWGCSYCSVNRNTIKNMRRFGLELFCSWGCSVQENNFIDNHKHAEFDYRLSYLIQILNNISRPFKRNIWDSNYWQKSRNYPYPIPGTILLLFNSKINNYIYMMYNTTITNWINFDWNPASEPYDIGV